MQLALSDADYQEIAERLAKILAPKLAASPSEPEAFVSEQKAAALLGVEPHCLRDCRKRGQIQFHRIGKFVRYSTQNLEDFKQRVLQNGRAK